MNIESAHCMQDFQTPPELAILWRLSGRGSANDAVSRWAEIYGVSAVRAQDLMRTCALRDLKKCIAGSFTSSNAASTSLTEDEFKVLLLSTDDTVRLLALRIAAKSAAARPRSVQTE